MVLSKLALKNVKTQFKSYVMYLVSMIFSVMVYYSFIAMSYDKALIERMGENLSLASALRSGGVMIVLFIVVFMFSANGFFLKRRKKEIGLYHLLGMRKYQIGMMFFFENMLLGLSALVVGVLAGLLFSKLFSMILIKVMFLEIDSAFSVSFKAITETVFIFLLILLILSLRSGRVVYRYKLVDLFHADKKSDTLKRVTVFTYLKGIIGISLLSYGYFQASHFIEYVMSIDDRFNSDMGMLSGPIIILLVCVLGTYLFFDSFLQVAITLIQKIKPYYYRDINMVTTGNLRFRMKKNATTLGTIAVLSGTALSAIGGATTVYSFGMETINSQSPFDFIVDNTYQTEFEDILREQRLFTEKKGTVTIKSVGGFIEQDDYGLIEENTTPIEIIAMSNYNDLAKVNPYISPIELKNSEEMVILERGVGEYYSSRVNTIRKLVIQDKVINVDKISRIPDRMGGSGAVRFLVPTIIVSDVFFEDIKSGYSYTLSFFDLQDQSQVEEATKILSKSFIQESYYIVPQLTYEQGKVIGDVGTQVNMQEEEALPDGINAEMIRHTLLERNPGLMSNRVSFGLLVYAALFLGVVFLIATGSMIVLKQLSEAEDEKSRYEMLRKIGVSRRQLIQSVYKQNFLVFFLPLIIAVLHSKFALAILNLMIYTSNQKIMWSVNIFLLIIYVGFYLGTSSAYKKTVLGEG